MKIPCLLIEGLAPDIAHLFFAVTQDMGEESDLVLVRHSGTTFTVQNLHTTHVYKNPTGWCL